MLTKTKNKNKPITAGDQAKEATKKAGMILMTMAATLGMVELPDHNSRIILTNQPAFAQVTSSDQYKSSLRREREEISPHYISYNVAQRTTGRSGKQ
ncbi:MAG: hypothetical protein NVS1B10_01280 [Candidatus Saccharimonadales bacterium]